MPVVENLKEMKLPEATEVPSYDMLKAIFEYQCTLNDLASVKNKFNFGVDNFKDFIDLHKSGNADITPNGNVAEWLSKYNKALSAESEELQESIPWKWWSKDNVDIQNARVEIIDMLHFLVSLCVVSGMSAEDVFNVYKQKFQVNVDRMNNNYSKSNKDESDNRSIGL